VVRDLGDQREVLAAEARRSLPTVLVVRAIEPGNLHGVAAATVVVLVEPDGSDDLSEAVLMNGLVFF
jgi:hypothetical protein